MAEEVELAGQEADQGRYCDPVALKMARKEGRRYCDPVVLLLPLLLHLDCGLLETKWGPGL